MVCNANNAAFVKINRPITQTGRRWKFASGLALTVLVWLIEHPDDFEKTLAICLFLGIIIITRCESRSDLAQSSRRQNPGSSPKWDFQCPSREGAGPLVSGRRLLRPAGPDAGQIRNAAPSSERGDADQPCCCQLRFFSSCFLQSPAGLYWRGHGGAHSQTPRPQGETQANRRDPGVYRANPRSGTICPNARVGPADSEKVCHSGAPSKSGARFGGCEKKTEHAIVGEGEARQLLPAAMLTEQYETLRAYVLARNGSSSLRLGQGVLMARGMAAWIQVAKELIPPARSAPSSSSEALSIPLLVQGEMIQLMGGAVMTLVCRGSL